MSVLTSEPGVQFYTSNFLNGKSKGKGFNHHRRSAFCFETQHFPDSPNHKTFPTTLLKKGEKFESYTAYSFGLC